MLPTLVSRATVPSFFPTAHVHACVTYRDGSLIVSEDGLKVARNFASLVVDHLPNGNGSLSLTIFRGWLGQPNAHEYMSVRELTSADREYVETIFGYEIGRIATNGGMFSYYRSSITPSCGIDAQAVLDVSLSGALCGKDSKQCNVECTATECRRID